MSKVKKPEIVVVKRQVTHAEAARSLQAFALRLAENPAEAKAFRDKTGVFDAAGELTAAYR